MWHRPFVKRVESLKQLRSLEAFVSMQHTGEAQHHPLSQGQGRIICVNAASCAKETTNLECRSMRHTSQCSYWSRLFHSGHILESLIVVSFLRLLLFETPAIDPLILGYNPVFNRDTSRNRRMPWPRHWTCNPGRLKSGLRTEQKSAVRIHFKGETNTHKIIIPWLWFCGH